MLPVVTFWLQCQSRVVITDSTWPTKPEWFLALYRKCLPMPALYLQALIKIQMPGHSQTLWIRISKGRNYQYKAIFHIFFENASDTASRWVGIWGPLKLVKKKKYPIALNFSNYRIQRISASNKLANVQLILKACILRIRLKLSLI